MVWILPSWLEGNEDKGLLRLWETWEETICHYLTFSFLQTRAQVAMKKNVDTFSLWQEVANQTQTFLLRSFISCRQKRNKHLCLNRNSFRCSRLTKVEGLSKRSETESFSWLSKSLSIKNFQIILINQSSWIRMCINAGKEGQINLLWQPMSFPFHSSNCLNWNVRKFTSIARPSASLWLAKKRIEKAYV